MNKKIVKDATNKIINIITKASQVLSDDRPLRYSLNILETNMTKNTKERYAKSI